VTRRQGMDARGFGLSEDELRQLGFNVGPKGGANAGAEGASGPEGPSGTTSSFRRVDRSVIAWIGACLALGGAAWASSWHRSMPEPVSAGASETAFSSARAMTTLSEIARRPHPTGSAEHDRVRDRLVEHLQELGLDPQVQLAISAVSESGAARTATVRNILARIPGSASTGAVALVAHYDTAPLSPGAGDDGMGVAMILETVRSLTANVPLRNDVVLALFDADEVGGLGARAFAEHHPWATDIGVAVVADFRASTGPMVLTEAASSNGTPMSHLLSTVAEGDPASVTASLFEAVAGRRTVGSLLAPLVEGGVNGLSLTTLAPSATRGQTRDVVELASERTLQHAGNQLGEVLRHLGAADLSPERSSAVVEQVYVWSAPFGLIGYPSAWVPFVSLGLLGLWGLTGLTLRHRGGGRKGVIVGGVVFALTVGASLALSVKLLEAIRGLHPELGRLDPALYREAPHLVALAALAFALVSVTYIVARRWYRTDELALGALAIPVLLCLLATWRAPLATPAIQWPLAASLSGAWLSTLVGPARRRSPWVRPPLFALAVVTVLLGVPSLELLAHVWTFRAAGALGAAFALGFVLLLPVMGWLVPPRAWWAPATALAAAAILVVTALPSVRGGVDHPTATAMIYLADEPVRARLRLPGDALAESDSSRIRLMDGRWLAVSGEGDAWIQSWVPAPASDQSLRGPLLLDARDRYEVVGVAPQIEVAPPRARVLEEARIGDRRTLRIAIRSGLGGEMLGLHLPEAASAEWTSVGGAEWPPRSTPVREVVHWGRPEGGELELGMTLDASLSRLEIDVIEHHLRPRELLGDSYFVRPDSIVPDASNGSDRAIQRTRLRLPLTAHESLRPRT